MILAVVDDLLFTSKIKSAAARLGVPVVFARSSQSALSEMRKEAPTLVIFDLDTTRTDPLGTLAAMKGDAAPAGNHGIGLAFAAQMAGVPLVVFTPAGAPTTKIAGIARHGATVRSEGRDYDDTERLAKRYAEQTGAEYISPYNDRDVIAG